MSIVRPEIEYVDRTTRSIRYLEHGWPTELCRWHSHEEYELHLVVATRGKAFVGDYIGDFNPGSLYLTGPNLPHNWITDKVWTQEVATRDMLVQFNQQNIDELSDAFPEFQEMQPMFELARSGIEFVNFDPEVAKSAFEAIRDAKGAERIVAFLRFLVQANEHQEKKALSVVSITQPQGNSKQVQIGKVVDYIVKNFADELSVESAAAIAGMSPTAFSRNFQAVTGNKFVEFVNRVRIGQACSMLYATENQITSICYESGFQNLANFNRHFLKMKKMTPSAYRELARDELTPQKRAAL
ncbi:helix-turn-helix domain-containing protein [Maritalea sp.]|jgi:AraC-like DNA-binding protein|uniref:helix-turn-helix domain-containing protein n=1 Tax=Maritalea sp. TaxID=2003361 RepID=UPI0039E6CD64